MAAIKETVTNLMPSVPMSWLYRLRAFKEKVDVPFAVVNDMCSVLYVNVGGEGQ